jgi:Kef-type K+ transport system membrane component KefB
VFELGFRLDFDWLKRNRWLFFTAIAESLFSFASIYGMLVYVGFSPLLSAMAAAIGTATSPAVVMLVAHDLRAEGQITERMLLFTAVNSVFAYVALTLMLPFLHVERAVAWPHALAHPIYLLAGSLWLGLTAAIVMLKLGAWLGKSEERQFVLLVAMVVITVGIAHGLGLSVMLSLLTFGMLARNLDRDHALLALRFGHGAQLFFVILFVLTGASLDFPAAGSAPAVLVAAFIAVRFLGKALPLLLFGRLSGLRPGGAGLLAVALLPMSGLGVAMVRDTISLYPSFGRELGAVVLSAVLVLELLGPLGAQFALRRAGEAHPDG